ncbi:MAG: glycoside hydrolase family 26 protein [Lachnospiraceae bacterium]|nr:glycoside hydrolase family 26 protein [Lachnospiraceae bacterium]
MAQTTVNPNASERAKKLLNYLSDVAGKKIITGQHTQTVPMEEREYIRAATDRVPKLLGFELLSYSPNININDASEECLAEVYMNRNTLETAMQTAKETDSIITFSFHWYSPLGGRDKSFYTEHTDFDPEKVLIEGTPERAAFYSDMDKIAKDLKPFCDEDIPILWRPFHESQGTWFWWGSKGPEVAGELYKLMFDHYTKIHRLDNLIWVWNCPLSLGYPGDEYVDVISTDIYLEEYKATDYAAEYEEMIKATTSNKVAALAEVGYIPDVDMLEKSHIPWAYYMTWSKEFCIGRKFNSLVNLRRMYDSDYSIKGE